MLLLGVPAKIIEAPNIPYTFNMMKVEIAVTNIIHGRPVTNKDALIKPESLDYFEKNPAGAPKRIT
jgi:acetoacetyl-CoA synthetase